MTTSYDRVYGFFDDFRFLSNFYVEEDGLTGEHHFQACKTEDPEERAYIMRAPTPGVAKFRGRNTLLREGWEESKDYYMAANIARKFRRGSALAERLLLTGDAELIEANQWNDRYWGVDQETGEGENRLGKLLMVARDELRQSDPFPWVDREGERWSDMEGGCRVRESDGAQSEWPTDAGLYHARRF